MKAGMTLYIRTDKKIKDAQVDEKTYEAHLRYLSDYAKEMTMVGGAYLHQPGGMIIFEAKSLEDAHELTSKDPIILSGIYTYDLKAWEVIIASKGKK